MNNDIIPPRPPVNVPPRAPEQPAAPESTAGVTPTPEINLAHPTVEQPVAESVAESPKPAKSARSKYIKWVIAILAFIVLACAAFFAWYQFSLRPVASGNATRVNVVIASGSSPAQIGELLQEKSVIRSKYAFAVYTRTHNVRNKLQAGTFSLSPADSTAQIVESLTSGVVEQYDVTFYPGATLNIASTSADKTPSHRQVLQKLGFSEDEITDAFNASYATEYPILFADKPSSADLEGYIYGQTYKIASGATVKQILMRTFDEYETQIKKYNLVDAYKKQGLTLYEGITLASIIQREVPTQTDQKQVAQIFFKRLADGTMLGSDVTYHYAADKMGVARDHTLESPYNTRIHTGLPPGPIASPGITALQAVAAPAPGDYVYFLSGDDNKTYFAHTNEEHEANIVNHCVYKCSLP
jgi:UPF0755 protein